jgi:hypothetical protein
MVETEVESILREIRERVISQQGGAATGRAETANGGSGAGEAAATRQLAAGESEPLTDENFRLINSYLTTTARAWDRLPPLVSNRSGIVARLELWLKRRIKTGARWFTWEQVNFNAAVHHALRDLLQVLSAHEQELGKLGGEAEARRIEMVQLRVEVEVHRGDLGARLDELLKELRERDQHLQEEQRVCFKQLGIEASEAAVLEDRARRKAEALLEELTRRVEQLKK